MDRDLKILDAVVTTMGGTPRPGQRAMVEAVSKAIAGNSEDTSHDDDSDHSGTDSAPPHESGTGLEAAPSTVFVQAGTGTGKSLAYLVPGMAAAVADGIRVVVSTSTLALQRQILFDDAPRAATHVEAQCGRAPNVALLKGWNNYVCRHKVGGGYPDDDLPQDDLFGADTAPKRIPAPTGATDDQSDQVRRLLSWVKDTATGDRDDLPAGVDDRAWRQVSITKRECLGRTCPLVDDCFPMAAREKAATADVVVTNHALLGIAAAGNPILPEHDALIIDEAHDLAAQVRSGATVNLATGAVERVARTLRSETAGSASAANLDEAASALAKALDAAPAGRLAGGATPDLATILGDVIKASRTGLDELKGEGSDAGKRTAARAVVDEMYGISTLMTSDEVTTGRVVMWVDKGMDGSAPPQLHAAPLDVSTDIRTHLMNDTPVILTSATLALGGTFAPAAREVGAGAESKDWTGVDVGTPFDYGKQGILYVARHLPRPGQAGTTAEVLQEIVELCQASNGGVLGLFSSWARLREATTHLREETDLEVFCQGEDSPGVLIESFRAERNACLFGTMSMWQGIDVPGDACRMVMIDRMPFAHPGEPVTQARIEAAGNAGFMQVSVTHAALRMAQAAGRLIRRATDRGVVAVLDPRLITARYGGFVKKSMPPMWATTDPTVVRGALSRLAAA